MRNIGQLRRKIGQDGEQSRCRRGHMLSERRVGETKEERGLNPKNGTCLARFRFPDLPGLLLGERFEPLLTGREKNRQDSVTALNVEPKSSTTTDRFVVGMRGDYQHIHDTQQRSPCRHMRTIFYCVETGGPAAS